MAFARLEGLGVRKRREILAAAPSPAAFFNGPDALHARFSITPAEIDAALQLAGRELEAARALGAVALTPGDDGYPKLLAEIPDPPPVLYALGDIAALSRPAIAIVGTRRASTYGLNMARRFARELAEGGVLVVSGGARGVDAAAHEAALAAGGRTCVVAGTGLAVSYPKEHAALYREIASRGGAIVSEFPPDAPPKPWQFPQRNRIIAGLALGTLVVEATEKSGSLITARLALDCGREVFAVPGNLTAGASAGANRLIQRGEAKLVMETADLLAELRVVPEPGALPVLGEPAKPAQDALLAHLPLDAAIAFDDLIAASGLAPGALTARLVELQLAGEIEAYPGGKFGRKA